MVSESLAIIAVLLVTAAMYLRTGKHRTAALVLPLLCVPVATLLATGLASEHFVPAIGAGHVSVISILIAGLILTVALCVLLSKNIENRPGRIAYCVVGCLFSGALVVAALL